MTAAAYEEVDADEAEARAREILMDAIGNSDHDLILSPTKQANILRDYIHSKKIGNPEGILTGYPQLDNMCGGGLRRGDLIVVAARTSVGKSSYAENVAENVAYSGKTVLFASIEMSPEQMMYRYAVRSGQLSGSAVEFGIDNDSDEEALEKLGATRAELPFFLMNSPSATTTAVRSAISRIRMSEGKLDLVVIDYLQLLKDRTRQEERLNIGEMTSSLKAMAREFEVPIMLLSQLNRNIEYRGGEPHLADLRESGRIEEDSDIVILLWKTDKPDTLGNVTHMKIAKNRQGPTGPIDIVFHQPTFKFTER
jgi:replicative DNA helicase